MLVLCLWLVFEAASIYPFYIAYFNELTGGPANGYKHLVESSLDVGQDLKRLAAYVQRHHLRPLKLAYFGPDDASRYGIEYTWLKPGKPTTGYVAISVTLLQGAFGYDSHCANAFAWLRPYEPIAKIGYSIFVYWIPASDRTPASTAFPPECEKGVLGP